MAVQPRYRPLEPSGLFADGRSARPLVAGTVARGHLRADLALYTGRRTARGTRLEKPASAASTSAPSADSKVAEAALKEEFVDEFPFPITEAVLLHGYHRYMIYCVVCHDPLGAGRGKIVERGYTRPPSYHIERLRRAPVGYLFAVSTEGYGSMPSYAEQIPARDRWAIVAYLRALQLSQHYPAQQLTREMRAQFEHPDVVAATGEKSP